MGLGAILEPLVVVSLLFGGTYVNRDRSVYPRGFAAKSHAAARSRSSSISSPDSEVAFLPNVGDDISRWRTRRISILGWSREVTTPNTAVYADTALSRLLKKFPFLAEAWYWALIYWVYQLGRAATAVTLQQGTVDVARTHALELIALEQRLGLFVEPQIQTFFLAHPQLLKWINWLYSFIHIPGTIFFLVFLYHFCITSNRITHQPVEHVGMISASASGPALYEARRRTMATCNLLAFIVFTLWPCMPPRLLSDPEVQGEVGELARSFGFVDTVHSKEGASSVWTQNKFCNQYAAMPSLHFGYSLLVGLTIATLPLEPSSSRRGLLYIPLLGRRRLGRRRALCLLVGFLYPFSILTAIVSTANHFVLDAVAGACVCALGWYSNGFLLNLLPLEDYFLSLVRVHKPQYPVVGEVASSSPISSITLFMADGDDDNEKTSLPQ